jgi:serine/threonine-protein kinase
MLELEIHDQEREHLGARGTTVSGAYDAYLQGLGYLQSAEQTGSLDNAITSFGKAVKLDADYAAGYAGLGQSYWQKYLATKDRQWVTSAHQNCQRSLELDPGIAIGHICAGEVQMGTGAYKDAASEFDLATTYEPSSDDAFRDLAKAYQLLGRMDEAERTLQKAIQIRPQYWRGYYQLGVLYSNNARYDEAVSQFKRATELAPDTPRAWASLGGAYIHAGDFEKAISALQRAISIRPNWGGYSNLGTAQLYERNFGAAISSFEQGAKLGSQQVIVLGNLARAYHWDPTRRTEADAAYRRAIAAAGEDLKVNPQDADAFILLANYHAMVGEKAEALAWLQKAEAARPDDSETAYQAAIVYAQFGDHAKALTALEQAAARGYSSAEIEASPEFDVLRDEPRYQALIAKRHPKPKF